MDKIDTAQGRKLLEAAREQDAPWAKDRDRLSQWLIDNAAALLDAADKVAEPRSGGVPAGWKLVPIEPTEAMLEAGAASVGDERIAGYDEDVRTLWSAMLSASPDPAKSADHSSDARNMVKPPTAQPTPRVEIGEAMVERAAKVISGAPFPSKASMTKARAALTAAFQTGEAGHATR